MNSLVAWYDAVPLCITDVVDAEPWVFHDGRPQRARDIRINGCGLTEIRQMPVIVPASPEDVTRHVIPNEDGTHRTETARVAYYVVDPPTGIGDACVHSGEWVASATGHPGDHYVLGRLSDPEDSPAEPPAGDE